MSCRIQKTEFLGNINSSVNFVTRTFIVQPGNSTVFPWLSQVAANFETYRFNGVTFSFKTTSSDQTSTTNTALGQVIMVNNPDSTDISFSNKFEMKNYTGCRSCKPSENLLMNCYTTNPQDTHYVRTTSNTVPVAGTDRRLSDWSIITVAVDGMAASGFVVGELYISYDVELYTAKLFTQVGNDLNYAATWNPIVTTSNWISNTGTVFTKNTFGCTIQANSITFPQLVGKNFRVMLFVVGQTPIVGTPWTDPTLSFANCALVPWAADAGSGLSDSLVSYFGLNGRNSARWCMTMDIQILDQTQQAVLGFAGGTIGASGTIRSVCTILQIAGDLVTDL